jgi:hypothetical protein
MGDTDRHALGKTIAIAGLACALFFGSCGGLARSMKTHSRDTACNAGGGGACFDLGLDLTFLSGPALTLAGLSMLVAGMGAALLNEKDAEERGPTPRRAPSPDREPPPPPDTATRRRSRVSRRRHAG